MSLKIQRVVRERREPLVRCAWVDRDDRSRTIRSCGEMIPYGPKKPCPKCGATQVRSSASSPGPDSLVIEGDGAIVDQDTGEVVAVQIVGNESLASSLAQQLRHIRDWQSLGNEGRMSGISVVHNTFGYAGPTPFRSRWACTRCRFDRNFPDTAETIYEFVTTAERRFREFAPDVYARTAEAVASAIPPAWRIEGTPWTSGIINHTAALPFHRDSGNIKGSWSAMIACRSGINGGLLYLADYDLYLSVPHGSISIFDGQSVLHGVTPFQRTATDAYRYTLVCYAKRNLKICHPDPDKEGERAALRVTEKEAARHSRHAKPKA